jgi:hypothetical protein
MFQSTLTAEARPDPYDDVPLGVEAIVAFLHGAAEIEGSRDEDRPATRQVVADPGWRG